MSYRGKHTKGGRKAQNTTGRANARNDVYCVKTPDADIPVFPVDFRGFPTVPPVSDIWVEFSLN